MYLRPEIHSHKKKKCVTAPRVSLAHINMLIHYIDHLLASFYVN